MQAGANGNTITLRNNLCFRLRHVWGLIWTLSLRSDSCQMSALASHPVNNSRVRGDSVVPNDNSLGLPSHTCLVIDTTSDVVKQELEKIIAFLLLEAVNGTGD